MYKDTAREVTVEISNFCILNCIHCSTWYSPDYYCIDSYVTDTDNVINKTIEHIKSEKGPIRIRFSGGEPLLFLDIGMFKKIKRGCPNVTEWIVNTSGSIPLMIIKNFVRDMEGFEDIVVYRISLYGNKIQHTKITRSLVSYNNSIKTIEWLLKNGQIVELTTPIFSFYHLFNVMLTARKYGVPIRVTKLIGTPTVVSTSQKRQLCIAKIMKIFYHQIYLTCSLYGDCKRRCDYPKSTVLATGKIIGCAIDKMSKNV